MKDISYINTPIGNLKIHTCFNFLHKIEFINNDLPKNNSKISPLAKQVKLEIKEYFNGTRKRFKIPIKLNLPPFYKRVLLEVKKIEYGFVTSYFELAKRVENQKATRAVGSANAKNPIPLIIPCHRVILSNQKIGKYSGGIEKKVFLLEHERINIF